MAIGLAPPSYYYWIGSKTVYAKDFFGVQDPDWYSQATAAGMVCECGALHPDHIPMPVDMDVLMEPPGFCSPARLAAIIRKDFYAMLRPHMIDQIIGKVYVTWEDEDGTVGRDPCPAFLTCYTPPSASITCRGQKKSWYIYCHQCRKCKDACATKPAYFLKKYTQGKHVVQERHGSLYISDSLFYSLSLDAFSDLDTEKIDLRDHPADGLVLPGDAGWDPANYQDGVVE